MNTHHCPGTNHYNQLNNPYPDQDYYDDNQPTLDDYQLNAPHLLPPTAAETIKQKQEN